MTTEHARAGPSEQLLGEIEARIVGMQYCDARMGPSEQIHLEREPNNPHDEHAIRVENGRFEPVGHLPRRLSSWLALLIQHSRRCRPHRSWELHWRTCGGKMATVVPAY